MASTAALIIGRRSSVRRQLSNALELAGFAVGQMTPDEAVLRPEQESGPSALLISAAVGLQRVALLSERFAVRGRLPTTVVYPDGDGGELEICVRGGFDYVTPPFVPSLLRMRLASCWERGELTLAVEEMANAASLHTYERDLSIAREIQAGFLPDRLPVPDGWEVAERFRPAHLVAGDFYDVFELTGGRRLAAVVGDVCDKGVGAALFMALIRTMLRHTAEQASGLDLFASDLPSLVTAPEVAGPPPPPVLSIAAGPLLQAVSGTNSYVARHHYRQGYFCTVFFSVLEPISGVLLYVNGGHNPALLVRADGQHAILPPTGPAVGMFPNGSYLVEHASLRPGDSLFIYTDGVPESRNPVGEFFGVDRMVDVVTRHRDSAVDQVAAVDAAVQRYTGVAEQHDDITMLALRRSAA